MIGTAALHEWNMPVGRIIHVQKMINPGPFCWDSYRIRRQIWGVACVPDGSYTLMHSDGRQTHLSTGDIALIPPSAAYRFVVNTPVPSPYVHYTINFDLAAQTDGLPDMDGPIVVHPTDFSLFENLFVDCLNDWTDGIPGYYMRVAGRVCQIVGHILRESLTDGISPMTRRQVEPARRYMLEHLDQNLSLDYLAGICRLSKTHFRRLFQATYHMAPLEYLLSCRLEHAKYLLHAPDITIAEIAAQTGFRDTSYFIRFFKSHTGITPLKYRKSI